MKITLILFVVLVCNADLIAQIRNTYDQRTNGGLCSSTYFTFQDSTFSFERGCEASSYFSLGHYTINTDTIIFIPWNDSNKVLVKSVEREKDSSKILKVKIVDINGINVSKKVVVAQKDGKGRYYSMTLDSTETYRYDFPRSNSILVLKHFERPFKNQSEVQWLDSNNIVITINLHGDLLQFPKSKWTDIADKKFLLDENGFHCILPDSILLEPELKDNFFWKRK